MSGGVQAQGLGSTTVEIDLLEAIASPLPFKFDNYDITYVASGNGEGQIETITYKEGVVTVGTLTASYDSLNRISNVTVV